MIGEVERLKLGETIDLTATTIQLPNLIDLHLREQHHLSEEELNRILLGSRQIKTIKFYWCNFDRSAFKRLSTYLPVCQEISLENCSQYGPDNSIDCNEFKSLRAIHLRSNGIFQKKILTSLAAGEVPLQVLSVKSHIYINDEYVLEYIIPLKHLRKDHL